MIVALVLIQVKAPSLLTPTFGGVMFCVKVVLALAVQPLLVLVTVTLYAPATVALNDATLPGLVTPVGTVQA